MEENDKNNIKVSIITINYNNYNGLRKTLESVKSQTSNNFEHIIIDGGSSDGSVDVINEFLQDENYKKHNGYWCSEKDKGIYNAMNKGVQHAKGEYCLILNSSDLLFNEKTIEDVIPFLDGTDVISGVMVGDNFKKMPDKEFSLFSYIDSYVPHGATFVKTNLCKEHPYREDLKIISDYVFFYELFSINASYKTINNVIEYFDLTGISNQRPPEQEKELNDFYKEIVPPLAWKDYKSYREFFIIDNAINKNPFVKFIFKCFRKILRPFYG